MRALIVVADPDPASFLHGLAAEIDAALHAGGHHVDVLDLCAAGYRPAMSPAEKRAYDTNDPVVERRVAADVELVRRAEALLVVYPTVLNAPPAVLKGWFERTMVPGVAFVFDRHHKVRPGLRGLRHLVGVSTYDEPRHRVRRRGDAGRRLLTRTLRTSTGLRARSRWLACYAPDPVGRASFRAHVLTTIGHLR